MVAHYDDDRVRVVPHHRADVMRHRLVEDRGKVPLVMRLLEVEVPKRSCREIEEGGHAREEDGYDATSGRHRQDKAAYPLIFQPHTFQCNNTHTSYVYNHRMHVACLWAQHLDFFSTYAPVRVC